MLLITASTPNITSSIVKIIIIEKILVLLAIFSAFAEEYPL